MKNDKMGPVQGFAFGGIANPTQRATLRPSDRAYLEARQRELDAYERQRLAYNKALEEYQSREQTEEFGMAAPVLPFKEAEVAARQQQAAQRARRDAGNRAAAIDVVSDPERFGFGSMSIADRFMAKGGEVRGYAEGGEADEDDEEGVGEVGSAKALLAQLEGQEPASEKKKTQSASLKRMAMSGGAAMPKVMDMSPESLASTRELVAMAKDKGTAKEQMAELARLYQLRAATFSQPRLSEQTFNKNTLAARRFAEGGEAKKSKALPTVMEVRDYATEASERLFPDQGGQDDQRDAARHMLAGAALARRYGPNVAKLLGLAHEYSSNPQTFFSGLGIGQPRDDFEYDEHNNRVGMGLASQATSREELEALVREMAAKASTQKKDGRPWIMGQDKMDARAAKAAKGPAPRPQGYQKGGIVKALKGTKAVDEAGKPVTTYRGEYGASDMPSTQLGSYTFGSKDAANLYASSPNDSRNAVEAMKVFPAQLSIRKPLVNTPDDPFVDLKFLRKALGQKEFKRVVNKNADRIENTGAFEELADAKGYDSLQDLLEKNPKDLDQLYTEIFPILDDPKTVKTLQRRGYDGAIYGGSGATALEPEYRVFSTSQAISPFGNKPMSPRSARQQLGDLAQSMEISPTDALGFFGRAAGVAASALTPSSLNEGEDEELRRRQSKPATIDKPVNRAKGSPEEGEMMDPEAALFEGRRDVPAKPSMTNQEFLQQALYGVGDLPYVVAGAPVDLAAMVMAPFGYKDDKPFMGSADIKDRMTRAGIRPADATDPRLMGPRSAAELLSSMTNPAAVSRKVGPVVEKGVKAGAREVGRQLDRAIMDETGPLAKVIPQAVKPMYISRSPGGYFPTSRVEGGILSKLDEALDPVLKKAREVEDPEKRAALTQLFNQKAKDFYTKQAGSVQDPLRQDILAGNLKFELGTDMGDKFPRFTQKSAAQGDLEALRQLEKNYDEMVGIRSTVPRRQGTRVIDNVVESQIIANMQANLDKIPDAQLVAYSGKKPADIPAQAAEIRQKLKDNPNLFSTVLEPRIAKTLFPESRYFTDSDIARYPEMYGGAAAAAMRVRGKRTPEYGEEVPPGFFLPEMEAAIEKGQPIMDVRSPRMLGMDPEKMLVEAQKMPTEELSQMSFPDFLKKAYVNTQALDQFEKQIPKVKKMIQDGKAPPADVMTYGVQDFLPMPDKTFRWVKVVKPDAVKAIAAGMDNSVASYASSTSYGALKKGRAALESGEAEVYALYDKNNVPHMTMEYLTSKPGVPDDQKNTIAQLTGNGPLTKNEVPEKYASQIVELLNRIQPNRIPTSIKRLLEETGQKAFLTDEAMAPLYFGVPIQSLRGGDDDLLQQLGAP